MSCPIEKNCDGKKWRRKHKQRKCDINSIGQPAPPLPALVMTNSSSPTLSEEFSGITTDEEEMELAKSLVLLSRGGNLIDQAAAQQLSDTPTSPPPSIKMEKVSAEIEIERHDPIVPSHQSVESTAKTTNKDFLCNICNKRFRSFQALGGHRASHKKPKLDSDEPKVQSSTDTGTTSSGTVPKLEDITNIKNEIQVNSPVAKPPVHMADNKPRVHRCQECSAEFSSGQALGGHMRKHKPLKRDGDASKNKKAEVATQQPSNDGLDRIAIQQSPSGTLDRIAIQPMSGGLDRIAIQQLSNGGLERIAIQQQPDGGIERIAIQQQPDGGIDRIEIIQQQPNSGVELDLNLPAQPDRVETIQQPPAIPPHDGNPPALTMQLFPGSSAVTNFL